MVLVHSGGTVLEVRPINWFQMAPEMTSAAGRDAKNGLFSPVKRSRTIRYSFSGTAVVSLISSITKEAETSESGTLAISRW